MVDRYGVRGEGTSNVYLVTLSDERIVRRHVDHIRSRTSQAIDPNSDNDVEIPTIRDTTPLTSPTSEQGQVGPTQVPVRRQSTRNRAPPERLLSKRGGV